MSDTNVYINAYVDNAVGMIHEQISSILQLKTRLKVSENIIVQKDTEIADIKKQLEVSHQTNDELVKLREKVNMLQEDNRAMQQKTSHMDTLLRQIGEMKNEIVMRDTKILELESLLTPPPTSVSVVINKKKKVEKTTLNTNDDF
jgi:small-conductance mechanosensitive channel